ncbi:MAG: TetR/AcrR family transcriptional regulator [Clostridia bacterium]|nr:TetR/AcrR family transcriptional regulator [Clostridia bacterium]
MEEKKLDRRTAKTKKAIAIALAKLLSEKEINKITITDIAKEADINRKTFYNYYSSVYEVIDDIENEIVSAFSKSLSEIDMKSDFQKPQIILRVLMEIIRQHADFYGRIFTAGANPNLPDKIAAAITERLKSEFEARTELDGIKLEIISTYTIAGMAAVYREWFRSGKAIAVEEVSKYCTELMLGGINGMFNE